MAVQGVKCNTVDGSQIKIKILLFLLPLQKKITPVYQHVLIIQISTLEVTLPATNTEYFFATSS